MLRRSPYDKIFPTALDPCFQFLDPGRLIDGELELQLTEQSLPEPEKGWSPCYHFKMFAHGMYAGRINLRVGMVWGLYYGGHIGYEVDPDFRGHRFAGRSCRLLLGLARAHGMQEVWINCRPDNIPSKRTIERLGAKLEAIVQVPVSHDLYRRGDLFECRFVLPTGLPAAGFERISENVSAVYLPFEIPVAPGKALPRSVWAFVIHSDPPVLIDAGPAGSEGLIRECVASGGAERAGTVFLTHSHPDHIGALAKIQRENGCGVVVHQAERRWVEDVEAQKLERPVPGFDALVSGLARVTKTFGRSGFFDLGGGLMLEAFHTPGHSAGSVSYLLQPDGVLFTGDAVPLPAGLPVFDNLPKSIRSIRALASRQDVRLVASSWDCARDWRDWKLMAAASLEHLKRTERTVREAAHERPGNAEQLAARALEALGYPPDALNPLTVRSLAAAVPVRA